MDNSDIAFLKAKGEGNFNGILFLGVLPSPDFVEFGLTAANVYVGGLCQCNIQMKARA